MLVPLSHTPSLEGAPARHSQEGVLEEPTGVLPELISGPSALEFSRQIAALLFTAAFQHIA